MFAPSAKEQSTPVFTTALVTNNEDPNSLGRIKLQYPWSSDDESHWARVVSFMSGANFGAHFLPEVGDEVLVTFLNADVQSPIVIGSLFNTNENPHVTEDANNNLRSIKSRSGHEIVFDDDTESNAQKLSILSSAGHKIILDDSSGNEKLTIKDSTGGVIELDTSTQKITIKSGMEIEIKAPNITIEAEAVLTLKGALVKIN